MFHSLVSNSIQLNLVTLTMGIHLNKTNSGLPNGHLIRLLLLTTFLGQVSDDFLNEIQLTASALFLIRWPFRCTRLLGTHTPQ